MAVGSDLKRLYDYYLFQDASVTAEPHLFQNVGKKRILFNLLYVPVEMSDWGIGFIL